MRCSLLARARRERRRRYQFDPKFGMFACKEILPELIARFEALDEVHSFYFYFCLSVSLLLLRTGAGRWT